MTKASSDTLHNEDAFVQGNDSSRAGVQNEMLHRVGKINLSAFFSPARKDHCHLMLAEYVYSLFMKRNAFLIVGPPGSGKGTQGRVLGSIPGFFHLACGDVFRALDLRTPLGKSFMEYSSRGQLVPDDLTIELWRSHMEKMENLGTYKPDIDHLVLDGIPRNVPQAEILKDELNVKKVFHLRGASNEELVERMRRRALKENRLDDANEDIIRNRLVTYEEESRAVSEFYGEDAVIHIDATQYPYQVLRDVLQQINTGPLDTAKLA